MKCPHCGAALRLGLELAAAPDIKPPVRAIPEPTPKKSSGVCACGHDRSVHEHGSGPCTYGRGTFFGGCVCADYHTRRRTTKATKPVDGELSKCARTLLVSLCVAKDDAVHFDEVAIRAGYSVTSGSTAAALTELRAAGLVEGTSSALRVTQTGLVFSQGEEPLANAPDVLEHWIKAVGTCAGALLKEIARVYPDAHDREDLANVTGYSPTSGSFAAALTELRRLRLVDGLTASKALMASVKP